MDWDLEAPGLVYYFRSLVDGITYRDIKDGPGVLDIVTQWTAGIRKTTEPGERDAIYDRCRTGEAFDFCTRKIIELDFFDEKETGCLDFIGAGSSKQALGSYGQVLSQFSWPSFIEDDAGGAAILFFSKWAKRNYDLILIDSRTGYADVAGICTMMIPDIVVLCFVLNRQNIEGTAAIARSIRNSDKSIVLRAAPMRVSKEGTAAETDARYRARYELHKVGGFPLEQLDQDLKILEIKQSADWYHEALAPIVATDRRLDPLTLNYVALASEILGEQLENPALDQDYVDRAASRLVPKAATVEFVSSLTKRDPISAISEVTRLLAGACDMAADGRELEPDYVNALVRLGIELARKLDDPSFSLDALGRATDLVRLLLAEQAEIWQQLMVEVLEHQILYTEVTFGIDDELLTLREELDGMLATLPSSMAIQLQRLDNLRALTQGQIGNDSLAAKEAVHRLQDLVEDLRRNISANPDDLIEKIRTADVELSIFLGDIAESEGDRQSALKEYQKGLNKLGQKANPALNSELTRVGFIIYSRLANRLHDNHDTDSQTAAQAANYAIQAAKWGAYQGMAVRDFHSLSTVVLRPRQASLASQFCRNALTFDASQNYRQTASYVGRTTQTLARFIDSANNLIRTIIKESGPKFDPESDPVEMLQQACIFAWRHFVRRYSPPRITNPSRFRSRQSGEELAKTIDHFLKTVKSFAQPEVVATLEQAVEFLRLARTPPSRPNQDP